MPDSAASCALFPFTSWKTVSPIDPVPTKPKSAVKNCCAPTSETDTVAVVVATMFPGTVVVSMETRYGPGTTAVNR